MCVLSVCVFVCLCVCVFVGHVVPVALVVLVLVVVLVVLVVLVIRSMFMLNTRICANKYLGPSARRREQWSVVRVNAGIPQTRSDEYGFRWCPAVFV